MKGKNEVFVDTTLPNPSEIDTVDGLVPSVADAPNTNGVINVSEGSSVSPEGSTSPHHSPHHSPRRSPPREPIGEFVDPAEASANSDATLELAISQTLAARACLYWPSRDLESELRVAGSRLLDFMNFLRDQENGSELIIGLCARLLGPEGLNPDQHFIEEMERNKSAARGQEGSATDIDDREALAQHCYEVLEHHLSGIVEGSSKDESPTLGHSRAVTIALLGDVGAFMTATGATTGTDRPDAVSRGLKEAFSAYALRIEKADARDVERVNQSVQRSKKLGGGSVIGPSKSDERKRVPEEALIQRTGIHDCGRDVDIMLGRDGKPGQLIQTRWASARLHKMRVELTTEPMAGHMSASPSEILWTWDVLAGRGLDYAYANRAAGQDMSFSSARAAGACAFLVGCGYHSALEVLHGTMVYMGQAPAQTVLEEAAVMRIEQNAPSVTENAVDAGAIFHGGAATTLVDELLIEMTSEDGLAAKNQTANEPTIQSGYDRLCAQWARQSFWTKLSVVVGVTLLFGVIGFTAGIPTILSVSAFALSIGIHTALVYHNKKRVSQEQRKIEETQPLSSDQDTEASVFDRVLYKTRQHMHTSSMTCETPGRVEETPGRPTEDGKQEQTGHAKAAGQFGIFAGNPADAYVPQPRVVDRTLVDYKSSETPSVS